MKKAQEEDVYLASLLNNSRMALVTSWDDGFAADTRVAQMLSRHGIAGTFFVTLTSIRRGRFSRRFLSANKMVSIQNELGMEIGSHTVSHPSLSGLNRRQVLKQLTLSKQKLEKILEKPVVSFAYPYGDYGQKAFWRDFEILCDSSTLSELLQRSGYLNARVASFDNINHVDSVMKNPYAIQTYSMFNHDYEDDKYPGISSKQSRCYHRVRELKDILERCYKDPGSILVTYGHSWEIEKEMYWGDLESKLSTIATSIVASSGSLLYNPSDVWFCTLGELSKYLMELKLTTIAYDPENPEVIDISTVDCSKILNIPLTLVISERLKDLIGHDIGVDVDGKPAQLFCLKSSELLLNISPENHRIKLRKKKPGEYVHPF